MDGDARICSRFIAPPWVGAVTGAGSSTAGRARHGPLVPYPMHVVHLDRGVLRQAEELGMPEAARGVVVPDRPVLAHRGGRELVVLGLPFIGALLVDELDDAEAARAL